LAANGHDVVYTTGLCGPADLHDFRYTLNGTYTTEQLSWGPGGATLRWLHRHRCAAESPDPVIAAPLFGPPLLPVTGRMRLPLNLWGCAGNGPSDHRDVEVVIRDTVTTCTAVAAVAPPATPGVATLAVRPNPFQGETRVGFTLPSAGEVQVTVQDV